MGRSYVVCRPCRRFVSLGKWIDGRDTRSTTFSCSVCGGDGAVVFEDPAKDGLQHDPRPKPPRHQMAVIRLQAMHLHVSRFGRREPTREEARPREKPPRPAPAPIYRLVPLPIRTFRDALDSGLALRVHCPQCHRTDAVNLTDDQLDRPFTSVRFTCAHIRLKVYGEGREVCEGLGWAVFTPMQPRDPIGPWWT